MLIKNKKTKFIDQVDYENISDNVYYYKDDNSNLIKQNFKQYRADPIKYYDDNKFYGGVDEALDDISKDWLNTRDTRDILDEHSHNTNIQKYDTSSDKIDNVISDDIDNIEHQINDKHDINNNLNADSDDDFTIVPVDEIGSVKLDKSVQPFSPTISNTFTKRDMLSSLKSRLDKYKKGGKEKLDKLYSIKEVVNTFIDKIYL